MDTTGNVRADARSRYLKGALYAVCGVSIWSAWMAITRLGLTTSVGIMDVTMLRFATAGIILLPIVIRDGLAIDRLGWSGLLILVCGAGAPYMLVAASGLSMVPASHAGAIIPGMVPLFVASLAALTSRESFTARRVGGYCIILAGLTAITGGPAMIVGGGDPRGDLLLLSAAFMWACYTIVLRNAGLTPLHATGLVSVGSAALCLPLYLACHGLHAIDAPLRDIVIQAAFQGIAATIVALSLYGKAISILGAPAGSSFGALAPVLAALLGIPILGEHPTPSDWTAILIICLGVYFASDGPLPRWRWMRRRSAPPIPPSLGHPGSSKASPIRFGERL